uniref:DDE_Tnp_1_7 domain-containing protein n=1 Tax=Strongyloides venezuelensis TaxID=75913 RepID=A0A0K0FD17_STRVS
MFYLNVQAKKVGANILLAYDAPTLPPKLGRYEIRRSRIKAAKREKHSIPPRPSLLNHEKTISVTIKSPSRQSLMKSRNHLSGKRNFITSYKNSLNKNIIDDTEKEFSSPKKMNKETNSYRLCRNKNYKLHHGEAYLVSSPQLNPVAQGLADKYPKKQKLMVDSYAIYGTLYPRVQSDFVSNKKMCFLQALGAGMFSISCA